MSQNNPESATTKPEDQPSDGVGQTANTDVPSPTPESVKTDGDRSEDPKKCEDEREETKFATDLRCLLQISTNDDDGFRELDNKLKKWKDLNGAQALKDLINTLLEDSQTTPLHVASEKGFSKMVQKLLEAGADANAQDDYGRQPLHIACAIGNGPLVKVLSEANNYVPNRDKFGLYPLHFALFFATQLQPDTWQPLIHSCRSVIDDKENRLDWTAINIAVFRNNEKAVVALLEANARLDIEDPAGRTPMIMAARYEYYGILDQLTIHLSKKMRKDIESVVDKRSKEGMTALMELCATFPDSSRSLQDALNSLNNLLKLRPSLDIIDDEGQTALHHIVRSVAGHNPIEISVTDAVEDIIGSAPKDVLLLRDREGETAFDVIFNKDGLIQDLKPLCEKMVERLKEDRVEELLSWLALRVERHTFAYEVALKIPENGEIAKFHQLKPKDFGKWLIYRQLPGCLLDYVTAIGQSEQENDDGKSNDVREDLKTWIRDLKAERQKGWGSDLRQDSDKRKNEDDQVIQSEDSNKDPGIIVLQDMEDIVDFFFVDKAPNSAENRQLSRPTKKMKESLAIFYAAISQMRQDNTELSRYTKFRTVQHVIYGTETLATVGEIIERSKKLRSRPKDTTESTARDDSESKNEFTWIHLPSTNMDWMNDLMRKILKISNCGDGEFEELASFLRTSWVEIPDRTSKSRFMRPRFVERKPARTIDTGDEKDEDAEGIKKDDVEGVEERTPAPRTCKDPKTKLFDCSALYMPYLSFSTYSARDKKRPIVLATAKPRAQGDEQSDLEESINQITDKASYRRDQRNKLFETYEGRTFHASTTLDEYYYQFAEDDDSEGDQDSRNKDQVVTKYIYPEGVEGFATWPLLRVNQLWAWTIGEDWLITASSCASTDEQSKFVKDILTHLSKRAKDGNHWRGPVSPADLRKVIAEYCIAVYERKYELREMLSLKESRENQTSPTNGNQEEPRVGGIEGSRRSDLGKQRSIRQIFSDSINEIGRGEADLFYKFCSGQPQDKGQPQDTEQSQENEEPRENEGSQENEELRKKEESQKKQQQLTELKEATEKAAKLLFQIKDVRDELNILKTIAGSQQKVQFGMTRNKTDLSCHTYHTCHTFDNLDNDLTAQYVLGDLKELDKAAAQTQEALHTTITLQDSQIANLQAEESVEQSQLANLQAKRSARQGVLAYRQAQESAKQSRLATEQGRIVLVFTLFTVVFVPLSFFSSLFALDVATFLEAPAWSLIVIFTAPLPLLGVAGAYAFWPRKPDSSDGENPQNDQEQNHVSGKGAGVSHSKETPHKAGLNKTSLRKRLGIGKIRDDQGDHDPETGNRILEALCLSRQH